MIGYRRAAGAIVLAGLLTACSSTERLDRSSYGCMAEVVKQKVPANLPDKRTHCLASGLIARYCSPTEAYMAGIGKEVRDFFTGGDAEWADWQADRIGVSCARHAADDDAIGACCAQAPLPVPRPE